MNDDIKKYLMEIRSRGAKTLKDTALSAAEQGRPLTCVIYTLLLPWASEVAREVNIPSALLCIQPATVLDIYYYYFNGFADEIIASSNDPSWKLRLPGLQYCYPNFEALDVETKPKVLVNTFDPLESDGLKAIDNLLRLPKAQMEEIAKGLLDSSRPFLWVIRANEKANEEKKEEDERLSCMEELEKVGRIVPWCSQLEVLTHHRWGAS
ncbi:UNVERIFIED_CONTAM: UDP-glycosyltransferase 75C1 [Sesamum latifolium]|uniref:UDP-glycosyltransferase 75C1 n=1 Tax=Sesamum latifolium TaxID=2727402 RepID=A0AAW2XDZ4_9LAMI